MKPYRLITLLLVLAPLSGPAQNKTKKHSDVPAEFQSARYVYVEARDGGDITKPGLYPEDRQAISDVQAGVQDWNRYALTIRKDQADLVFVLRRGRLVGAQVHGGVSAGSGPISPPGQNPRAGQTGDSLGVGTEVGPDDDLLQVFSFNPDGKLIGPIWTGEMPDGLDGPRVPLLQRLRGVVDCAYPNPPPKKQP